MKKQKGKRFFCAIFANDLNRIANKLNGYMRTRGCENGIRRTAEIHETYNNT
jgi:hypothetical protein